MNRDRGLFILVDALAALPLTPVRGVFLWVLHVGDVALEVVVFDSPKQAGSPGSGAPVPVLWPAASLGSPVSCGDPASCAHVASLEDVLVHGTTRPCGL